MIGTSLSTLVCFWPTPGRFLSSCDYITVTVSAVLVFFSFLCN